jgi:dihydrodipicolinate reductase
MITGAPVHSVRLPSHILRFGVIFRHGDERLVICHESGSDPEPFISATRLAIQRITHLGE